MTKPIPNQCQQKKAYRVNTNKKPRGVYTDIAVYKQLPEGVERDTRFNRMEIALVNRLVLVHAVLKWLHHLSEKNVMLLHP